MAKETGKHLAGGTPERRGAPGRTPERRGAPGRTPGGVSGRTPGKTPGKTGGLTLRQKLLIAGIIVLALALVAVLAYRSLFVRPELPVKTPEENPDQLAEETIDWGEGTRPRSDGQRKSADYYTVLILGRDTGGGGNTDTMLLASYDVTNQKATVMSIPRDTMVNVPWDIKRINSVYNYYGGGDRGIQYLYKEISQLVGFEPDYQVVVEWEAVGKIVEAMGGVWFDVPRNMNYDDPYQDLSIHQTKGYRLLSGDDAMQVLRYRHDNDMRYGYPDGDLGRIKTQQALLKAVVEQLLKLENIGKVNEFAKVFQENVETDLTFQNILWFAKSAYLGGLKVENVEFVTMPNRNASCWSRTVGNMQSYVTPLAGELLELVNTKLSPFVEPSVMSELDIMSVNRDGSVSSTTGHVEDSKAARPPVKPQPEEPEPQEPITDEFGNIIDPVTGLPIVPQPGDGTTAVDPNTGTVIDPNTGLPVDPSAGTVTDPSAGTTTPTDPSAGAVTPEGGTTTDPDAGTAAPPAEPGVDVPIIDPMDPGATAPEQGTPGSAATAPESGAAPAPDAGTPAPTTPVTPEFSVVDPAPVA